LNIYEHRHLVIGVDPGYERSAYVLCGFSPGSDYVLNHGIMENLLLLKWLGGIELPARLVLEKLEGYGMPVGREVMETIFWSGRFFETWRHRRYRVTRRDVKLHLCGQSRAKDANVRQALIDRFGPGKEKAIGTKKNRGPLYGLRSDEWAALGVAVTWFDSFDRDEDKENPNAGS